MQSNFYSLSSHAKTSIGSRVTSQGVLILHSKVKLLKIHLRGQNLACSLISERNKIMRKMISVKIKMSNQMSQMVIATQNCKIF